MEPCFLQPVLAVGSPFEVEQTNSSFSKEPNFVPPIAMDVQMQGLSDDMKPVTRVNIPPHLNGSLQVLDAYEKVLEFILTKERATGMHFVGHRKEGVFNRIGRDLKAFIGEGRKHIRYCITVGTKGRGCDPIPVEYTGVPFIEAGTYVMECHMGNDNGLWIKKRYAERRAKLEKENHQRIVKRRVRTLESKKTGCPAKIHIKRILRLPDFKIEKNTAAMKDRNRVKIMKALKTELENVKFEQQYYILMPSLESHQFHAVDVVAGIMVSKAKNKDLHLNQIRHYLENGVYLPPISPNEKKSIRVAAKSFKIEGSTMYYTGEEGTERSIVLYTDEERQKAFDQCHILHKSGEHLDCMQTLQLLKQRCYWLSMAEDVVEMSQQCHVCKLKKDCSNALRTTCIKKEAKKTSLCKQSVRGKHKKNGAHRIAVQRSSVMALKSEPNNVEKNLKSELFALNEQPSYETPDVKEYSDLEIEQREGSLKIVHSFDKAIQFVKDEERATGMHYVGHRKEGVFDKAGHNLRAFLKSGRKHIRYCVSAGAKGRGYDPVPVAYTGIPFIEAGTYVMECHLGADTGIWNKKRYAARRDRIQEEELTVIKRRCRMHQTKKMGCPAKVHIKRILRMPDFKIQCNTPAERGKNRKRVMLALTENIEKINFQTEYYVHMPSLEGHKFHRVDVVAGVLVLKGESGSQHLSHVRHYLETGTHSQSVPLHRKKSIRKSAQEFAIEDGKMYYQGKDGCERRFVPATEEEKLKAFKGAHILKCGQHLSIAETVRRLSESCYWTDLYEDAQTNFQLCQTCDTHKYRMSALQSNTADKQSAVSNIYQMSDGGSITVIANDYLNVEKMEKVTDCRESIIGIF